MSKYQKALNRALSKPCPSCGKNWVFECPMVFASCPVDEKIDKARKADENA